MEGNMCSNMHATEMRRKGLKKAILSLLVEWKEFEDHFDSTCQEPPLNQLQYHAQESRQGRSKEGLEKMNQVESSSHNPMHGKLKEIDLSNGACDDRVEVLENEVQKLKERWERLVCKEKEVGRVEVLCEEKLKVIEGKLKEMEFGRSFVEERAKELELRQKELDDGFKDLESRKLEFTQNPKKIGGVLCSSADMIHSKSSREPPPHLRSTNHVLKESCAVQNAIPKASHSLGTNLDHNQPTQPDLTNSRKTSYTSCPFCNTELQYANDSCNGGLCCSNCSKKFVVDDSGPHSTVPQAKQGQSHAPAETLRSTQDQPDLSQQKRVPRWEANLGVLDSGEFPPSSMENETNRIKKLKRLNRAPKAKDLTISDTTLKTRGKEYQRASPEDKVSPHANVNSRVLRNLRSTRRRREIDLAFGSVGNFDTRSGSGDPDPKKDAGVISSSAGMACSKIYQREQPYHLRSKNHGLRESCAVQSEIPKFSDSLATKSKHQQPTQPSNSKQTFEICPFCTIKFQYAKDNSNGGFCCPSCSKQILVNDSSPRSAVPQANKGKANAPAENLRSTQAQPTLCQEKRVPKWEAINLGNQKAKGLAVDDAILKTRGKKYQRVSTEDTVLPSANANPRKLGNLRSTKRRREIHSASASVRRFDIRSGSGGPDPEKIADNVFVKMMSELYKVHIPEEDGYVSSNRESKKSRLCSNPLEDQNQQAVDDNVEVELCNSAGNQETVDNSEVELCNSAGIPPPANLCNGPSKQKSILNLECPPELDYYVSAEPDCSNFAKDQEEKNISVDQIWACYDCVDSMPRFYAKIRKVQSPENIQITWLEPQPEGRSEIDWVKTGLPVACGKFACTSSEDRLSHLCFSHQIRAKNLNANTYVIYPRKGETWAIFKDWDITWKSDPKKHDQFQFEIVEVVSDFNNSTGVKIAHLEKVNGFLSLFQRKTPVGSPYLRILSCELLKFSHQVPSFRINESETDGVPKGCIELDPASLPDSLTVKCFPRKVNMEIKSKDTIKRSGKGQVNPTMDSTILKTATKVVDDKIHKSRRIGLVTECSPGSTQKVSSKQSGGFQDQGSADFFTPKRHGSLDTNPSNTRTSRTHLVADCSPCSAQKKGSSNGLDGFKDLEFNDFCPSKKNGPSDTIPFNISGSLIVSPDFSAASEVFHDFSEDKCITKFKPGQLWALYGQKDDNSKNYVQITNVEPALMIVYAMLLESTQPSPSSCGMFRVSKGESEIFFPSSFSHKVKAKQFGDDKYAICPWKGEIWAMHKSWNDKRLGFVLQSCEFDIVEVLKCNKDSIEVSSLIPQVGFKSVFMAPSKLACNTETQKILWNELSLFSHRIPAFHLNSEHSGLLTDCLQLDPVAFPVNMFN